MSRWRTKKVNPKAKDILAFHRAFLDSVRYTGRLFEMGQVVDYKLRSGHFLQDLLQAPWMFFVGKLHLLPERVRDRRLLGRIFARSAEAPRRSAHEDRILPRLLDEGLGPRIQRIAPGRGRGPGPGTARGP